MATGADDDKDELLLQVATAVGGEPRKIGTATTRVFGSLIWNRTHVLVTQPNFSTKLATRTLTG